MAMATDTDIRGREESADDHWDLVIEPMGRKFSLNLGEVLRFRDLLVLFVKRDFVTFYKQTVLGPLWFFIQPLLKVAIYYVIFARIANVSTDGVPPLLFYLTGLTFWEYFASSWKKTSETFLENQHIFGKVYFPRLVVPLSVMISNGIKLGIQFVLFAVFWLYYYFSGFDIGLRWEVLLLPVYVLIIAMLGLGSGLIVTSLTTKYRDLKFLLDTLIQLLMYLSPIIYPLSLAEGVFRKILLANPMTPVLEALKYSFLGTGIFEWAYLAYSAVFAIALVFFGLLVFNRTEKNFIDTV
jgi:lipopolysaccharide transport system permease protein